jgi:hypothetical protein
MRGLKSLLFDEKNKISAPGKTKLRDALPNCRIAHHTRERPPVDLDDDWEEFAESAVAIVGSGEESLRLFQNSEIMR